MQAAIFLVVLILEKVTSLKDGALKIVRELQNSSYLQESLKF
jgi:hypothetical protein